MAVEKKGREGKQEIELSGKDGLLFSGLQDFYHHNKGSIEKVADIINGKSKTSLRIIDCFVTSYSVENHIECVTNEGAHVSVHKSYKRNLNAFHGKHFSIFKRTQRIAIKYGKDKILDTTIAQLNFFKWIIENKILDIVEKHYDSICRELKNLKPKHEAPILPNPSNQANPANVSILSYTATGKKDMVAGCVEVKLVF
jgi:hypothetical protein